MSQRIQSRRRFLTQAAAACAAGPLFAARGVAFAGDVREQARKYDVCAFTKPFNSLSFGELADLVAEMGFDGIEAPVRRGGHIEPERVADDLPKLAESLAKRNLKIAIATTDIAQLDQPHAERTLKTLAELDVPRFRLAYARYDLSRPIPEQLEALRPVIRDIVSAGRELGTTPIYQNHAGRDLVGAPLWDLYLLAKDYAPSEFGVALDIGHATLEGGTSWPVQCQLLAPHLAAVYVKDFEWRGGKAEWTPLGQGQIDPQFFSWLWGTDFSGPVSLHVEYLDHNSGADTAKFASAFRQDRATLADWIAKGAVATG